MSNVTLNYSIGYLERELLFCKSKADFLTDLLNGDNARFATWVTIGKSCVSTTMLVSDLYSREMEATLLEHLRQLFLDKADILHKEILRLKNNKEIVIVDGA